MKKKKLLVSVLCAAAVVGLSGTTLTSCKKDDGDKPGENETIQVTVSFNTGVGASTIAAQKVNKGEVTTKPSDPTREGYTFGGWYTDSACSDDKKFDFATTLDADITLYAKWTANGNTPQPVEKYTVTFDSKGGSAVAAIADVESGATITKPTDPTQDGYLFAGWYKADPETDSNAVAWNFESDTVTGNVTLYAKWTANGDTPQPVEKYTVTFDSKGGSAVAAIADVESGATITKPTDPTQDGYLFAGWYKADPATDSNAVAWNFESDMVTGNVTLYAKWTANGDTPQPVEKYTVTFDSKGGSAVAAIADVESGATITKPTDPTQDGHRFAGWYKADPETDSNAVAWNFESDTVTGNVTLYAKWEALSLYQTLVDKGGVIINDDFNSYTTTDVLEDYSGVPGTKGLYQHVNVKNGAGDIKSNYVSLDGDTAHLVDTSEGGTQLIIDFGKELNNGIVEGAFDLTIVNHKTSWTFLQIYGSDAVKTNAEVFGFRTEKPGAIKYRLDGGSAVNPETAVTLGDQIYNIYFKADLETGKFTVTVDGEAFVTDGNFGITGLSYIKLVSSDGGQATMKIDNLVVRQDELSTADYIVKMKNKLAAEVEKLNLDVNYTVNKQVILDLQTKGNAAMEEKQDNEGVYEAYVSVLTQIKAIPTDVEQALLDAQTTAISTLQAEYDANVGKYTFEENSALYASALQEGIALIQATQAEADIPAALTSAQALLAAVDTDEVALQKMKVTAIEELNTYKQADDYSKYQSTQYQEILTTYSDNITNATDPDGVATALTAGKAALDELPTDAIIIANAKTLAIDEVNTYVATAITAANLSEADEAQKVIIDEVNAIKDAGIERINNAISTESIETIKHEIQNSVDAKIAEATQSVDDFKVTAKETVNSHSTKQQENITDETVKTAIADLATEGCTQIDNYVATDDAVADKQAITAIMNATIQKINEAVDSYHLSEAKETAKSSLQEYYNTKEILQNNSLAVELKTTLDAQIQVIENATDIAAIDGMLDLAKQAIDEKWTALVETKFTVTYANTTLENGQVIYGNAVIEPETAPTASDGMFAGWYADAELTKAYDFATLQYDNVTIYAKWYDATFTTITEPHNYDYSAMTAVPATDPNDPLIEYKWNGETITTGKGIHMSNESKDTRYIKIVLPYDGTIKLTISSISTSKRQVFIDTNPYSKKNADGSTKVPPTTYGLFEIAKNSATAEHASNALKAGTYYVCWTGKDLIIEKISITLNKTVATVYDGIEGTPTTTLNGVPANKEVLLENLSLTVRDGEPIALNTILDKVTITIDNEADFLAGTLGDYKVTISYGKYTELSFTVTIA